MSKVVIVKYTSTVEILRNFVSIYALLLLFKEDNPLTMPGVYIETDEAVLKRIFFQLRKIILETKIIAASGNQIGTAMTTMFSGPQSGGSYDRIRLLLGQPIRFDGPTRRIKKRNYYVVKNRLTKYSDDILEDEIRAGYMYVLVARINDVGVAYFYANHGQDLSTETEGKNWINWEREEEDQAWVIYDADGHIRAHMAGDMMETEDDHAQEGE